mmetsp:Transcript_8316/g.13072  ORF Transcript_8316/g.13072 Transcript_8316/m.13072 type:complete len:221 (+) Transcript_8316:185-847(+)|eukprot:CAMPEP_0198702604 /NCGR_PEP_ID=MMETSP1468-20131203/388852_1 /TAXON_ID=1461545 /ORGANISM="Mantoniella sp, Strain CCMP1436" /LENGTH=220 /DNA_ID=CAMNT_0044461153 /DNA_START=1772 /DNA_END=2434 /DNA_ORIENTATION=+
MPQCAGLTNGGKGDRCSRTGRDQGGVVVCGTHYKMLMAGTLITEKTVAPLMLGGSESRDDGSDDSDDNKHGKQIVTSLKNKGELAVTHHGASQGQLTVNNNAKDTSSTGAQVEILMDTVRKRNCTLSCQDGDMEDLLAQVGGITLDECTESFERFVEGFGSTPKKDVCKVLHILASRLEAHDEIEAEKDALRVLQDSRNSTIDQLFNKSMFKEDPDGMIR